MIGRSILAPADEANGATGTRAYEIVGVAGDVRAANGAANPILELYIPFERVPVPHITVLVLTRGSITSTEASIRHVVTRWMPRRQSHDSGAWTAFLRSRARDHFYLTIVAAFALVAAGILAGVGIYSVVVATVRQRRREFGIRVALGATRRAVLLSVVRRGAILTTWGIALGALLAFVSIRLLRGMLVGASPNGYPASDRSLRLQPCDQPPSAHRTREGSARGSTAGRNVRRRISDSTQRTASAARTALSRRIVPPFRYTFGRRRRRWEYS